MNFCKYFEKQNTCIVFDDEYTNMKNQVEKTFVMCYSFIEKGTVYGLA